ncbi:GH12354 [Drosophila grimshawi]|uniref:GH12354 n=1 Tax=Drosophila grimshawi TaxID=7222 RepID=B4JJ20_DROGR|nr:GH12354 [Drosophila grimshawi]
MAMTKSILVLSSYVWQRRANLEKPTDKEINLAKQHSIALSDLGQEITKLVEMLEDGKRRTIHQLMRNCIFLDRR